MQIIIEVKNHQVFQRLLDLLRVTEWLGGVKVWKKSNEKASKEMVYDFSQPAPNSKPLDISHLAGAWKDWDDEEFEDFLRITRATRQNQI
ncbi:MAG: hypothetical protein MUC59_10185 [Saprospiraceae bacterium]|jgi:hypothetical protein|nr:hypothetical protein [Saprospiraceae bacterium]